MAKQKQHKLSLSKVLSALDRKDRDFYDNLTDEEKKGFQAYVLLRYASSVDSGNPLLDEYYLRSTNRKINKRFFDIPSGHDKLKWLLLTTISPGMGNQNHKWIKAETKKVDNEVKNILMKLYPTMKEADIDVWATKITKKELKAHLKEYGEMDVTKK